MWPNSAFHDGNCLPHSLHGDGGVSSVSDDDRTRATTTPSGGRGAGLGEIAQTNGGGGSASDSVSVVSWWGGGDSGCGGRAGGAPARRIGVAMANLIEEVGRGGKWKLHLRRREAGGR